MAASDSFEIDNEGMVTCSPGYSPWYPSFKGILLAVGVAAFVVGICVCFVSVLINR